LALQPADSTADLRQQQLQQWLFEYTGTELSGQPAGSDAGFRRYFRYQHGGQSLIAMDAPPQTEDCRPFVKVAGLLAEAGVLVPEIKAQDLQRGFLLLSDLGLHTYLDEMQRPDFKLQQAQPLFDDAIAALIKFQLSSQPEILPPYDEALLRRELELFPEWYLQRHLGLTVDGELRGVLDRLFDAVIEQVLSQSQVYVHRDYMPRNLMLNRQDDRGVGVLDFQDAVYGPISYDIASLFKDAFISWPETNVEQWQRSYWQQALQAGLPVSAQWADFQRGIDVMGAQRHIKVIGIFARIFHRDGKPRYLADVPRFFDYLHTVAQRRPELPELSELLQHLQGRVPENTVDSATNNAPPKASL
jgi:aminoglycoside/choline kinase family phosphotransferase